MRRHRTPESVQHVSIHIGEYHVARKPEVINTVVGSCVAVCLYDPLTKVGGMNHILLPGAASWNDFDASARYGINAMELLINKMMRLGAERKRILAKAFGGACTLPSLDTADHIGKKNAEFVLKFLEEEGLRLTSCSLGGSEARKIFFHTDTGIVLLKKIKPYAIMKLLKEEKERQRQILIEAKKPSEVILF